METPPEEPPALPSVSTLALLIAQLDPSAAPRLLAAHTADGKGNCTVCACRWPCTLHAVATEAVRHARIRRLPGR